MNVSFLLKCKLRVVWIFKALRMSLLKVHCKPIKIAREHDLEFYICICINFYICICICICILNEFVSIDKNVQVGLVSRSWEAESQYTSSLGQVRLMACSSTQVT